MMSDTSDKTIKTLEKELDLLEAASRELDGHLRLLSGKLASVSLDSSLDISEPRNNGKYSMSLITTRIHNVKEHMHSQMNYIRDMIINLNINDEGIRNYE